MTPGLAFFYGGLVGEGAAISTMMMSFASMGIVTVLWALVGFSIAFAPNLGPGIVGDVSYAPMNKIGPYTAPFPLAPTITLFTYSMFQLMFAVITSAIISGSIVGKMKFNYFCLFTALWHLAIWCPLAHWVFSPYGWLFQYGAIDFAGGLVIHVSSGVSALVLTLWLGGRPPKEAPPPHNIPFVLLGTAMLWFGWFGFNAGSAVSAGYLSSLAFTNTQLAAACAMVTWNVLEILVSHRGIGRGRATAVGAASGALCGLVGVTPACGFVDPMWALFIGFFTSLGVYFVPSFMRRLGADDRLDGFAFHGVGGAIGSALTGLFANANYSAQDPVNQLGFGPAPAGYYGSFYGNAVLLGKQCAGISVTILFAAVGTSVIFWIVWAVGWVFGETVHIAPHKQDNVDEKLHRSVAYSRRDLINMPYSPSLVGMPSPSPDGGFARTAADVPPLDLDAPQGRATVPIAPAAVAVRFAEPTPVTVELTTKA